jgi:phosphatidylinositol-3-phosphatase
MKKISLFLLLCLLLAGCSTAGTTPNPKAPLATAATVATEAANTVEGKGKIPTFDHVIVLYFENRSYSEVIGNPDMPTLNAVAKENVLLTSYNGVSHPSLPNYIALIGGDTFNITSDCSRCFLNQTSLPDLLEKKGLTWKTYQEDMPSACYMGNSGKYVQKHNPFVYFDSIRNNKARCQQNVLPFTQLDADLEAGELANFSFIMPNLCHSGHDCNLKTADDWLKGTLGKLENSSVLSDNSLIFITFDEGKDSDSTPCCGLKKTGGHVAAVMISPKAKPGYQDSTPYDHYSLLKTMLRAWDLPDLGNTKNPATETFQAMWK